MPPRVNHAEALSLAVDQRTGTLLEWSCVEAMVRTAKNCRCCTRAITGGPDRIAAHVLGQSGAGVAACTILNGDPRVVAEFEQIKAELERRRTAAQATSAARQQARVHDEEAGNEASSLVSLRAAAGSSDAAAIDLTQRSLPSVIAAQKGAIPNAEAVNLLWSKALIENALPPSIVDKPHFQAAVLATATAGSAFIGIDSITKERKPRLATRQAFMNKLLDQTDASTMLQVNKLKAPMTRDTGLSVMSDGMANITSTSLLNVICSNPAGQFFVKNIDTTGKEKTKEYIAEQACLMIEAEGAENVVLLIMDGACRSSFPLINGEYPHIICMICAAHSIDLLLEDFAKPNAQGPVVAGHARFNFDTSFTRTTLEHNREIVKFITNHSKPLSIYRAMVEATPRVQRPRGGTELLKPGDTRFATEFIASERVLNCRLLLEQTVVSVEFNAWLGKQKPSVRDLGNSCKDLVLSVVHWNSTSAIVRATNPLYSMLRFCDGKRVPRNPRARAISRGRGRGRRRCWVRDKGSDLSASLMISASHHATATCRSLAVVCMHVGNKPVLSKYYMKMLAEDLTLRGEPIEHLPDAVRDEMHTLFLARWRYAHHPAMVAAAVVDPEFWDREWTTEPDDDEPSEWNQFEATVEQLAKTPGAAAAGHTAAQILAEYDSWLRAMKGSVPADRIKAAEDMAAWKWWSTYGRAWPHLRWFAMRLTAHGVSASACERNWSTYEWIHNKKRNRLGHLRAEKLVRSFSNLNLLSRNAMYESGFVEWDLEMIIDEPEEEPVVLRTSPRRDPRPTSGSMARARAQPALAPAVTVQALPLVRQPPPLPVTSQPTGARGGSRGRGGRALGGRAGR